VTFFFFSGFLAPLGAVTGAQFTLGFSHLKKNFSAASGYLFESAGYFAGGIIFTYLILPYFNPSAVTMSFTALLFIAGALAFARPVFKKTLLLLAAIMVFTLPWASKYFESFTLSKLYPGFTALSAVYSPYAQIVTAERNGETYIFSNGLPVLTLPNPDTERSEKFAHLPLLFHHRPQKVLLLGGAAKFVQPVLDHGVALVDYAEPDPKLLETLQKLWPDNFFRPPPANPSCRRQRVP